MEFIARQINNEEILYRWLVCGVADGDIEYSDLSYGEGKDDEADWYTDDKTFQYLMNEFTLIMLKAHKDGGLYCNGVCSDCTD